MTGHTPAQDQKPSLMTAIGRGLRFRCPKCGQGRIFRAYLKQADACDHCGEPLGSIRADDGPAYLTILIVGHLLAPSLLFVFTTWQPEPLVMFTGFAIGTVTLSLYLLPRLKGALVGFQWARLMHGFSTSR